jgi:hypothetical protein
MTGEGLAMAFAGISYVGVVLATVAGFLFGGVWYGIFSKPWMAAIGKTEKELGTSGSLAIPLIVTAIAQLVMAYVLAGVIGHLGPGRVTAWNGIISGFFIWVGFVLTTLVVNHSFQGQKRVLTVLDGGHWLGVLLIQGAIIGLVGV